MTVRPSKSENYPVSDSRGGATIPMPAMDPVQKAIVDEFRKFFAGRDTGD
jgi:hypothetical protein